MLASQVLLTLDDEVGFGAAAQADSLQWQPLAGGSESVVQTDLDIRLSSSR